jgi:hypothetical protein
MQYAQPVRPIADVNVAATDVCCWPEASASLPNHPAHRAAPIPGRKFTYLNGGLAESPKKSSPHLRDEAKS